MRFLEADKIRNTKTRVGKWGGDSDIRQSMWGVSNNERCIPFPSL